MSIMTKIACIQITPFYADVDQNLEKAERYILEACENGANLLVVPELFNIGSVKDRQIVRNLAEKIPEGKTSQWMMGLAMEKGVYICGSILEIDGVDIYNTAILMGPDGFIGKYRKLHLCGREVHNYEPGNLGIPVFRTPIGRIAMLICQDSNFPETFRIAAMQGADIVLVPFAGGDWMEKRGFPDGMHTMVPAACMYNSLVNHIYVVGCNRTGVCNGVRKAGQSIITNTTGGLSAPIAPYDEEVILYAEVDLVASRDKQAQSVGHGRIADRREDIYDTLLGYDPKRFQ